MQEQVRVDQSQWEATHLHPTPAFYVLSNKAEGANGHGPEISWEKENYCPEGQVNLCWENMPVWIVKKTTNQLKTWAPSFDLREVYAIQLSLAQQRLPIVLIISYLQWTHKLNSCLHSYVWVPGDHCFSYRCLMKYGSVQCGEQWLETLQI